MLIQHLFQSRGPHANGPSPATRSHLSVFYTEIPRVVPSATTLKQPFHPPIYVGRVEVRFAQFRSTPKIIPSAAMEDIRFVLEAPQNTRAHKKRPRLVTSCDNWYVDLSQTSYH